MYVLTVGNMTRRVKSVKLLVELFDVLGIRFDAEVLRVGLLNTKGTVQVYRGVDRVGTLRIVA